MPYSERRSIYKITMSTMEISRARVLSTDSIFYRFQGLFLKLVIGDSGFARAFGSMPCTPIQQHSIAGVSLIATHTVEIKTSKHYAH